MADEISTAGSTISTEFMKKGFRPPQSMPVQAVDHALAHESKLGDVGSHPWPTTNYGGSAGG